MRILVTGALGFSGRHLVEQLKQAGADDIYCADFKSGTAGEFLQYDLTSEDAAGDLVERVIPDQIYHLAGTFTNDYNTDYAANVISGRNLLESVRKVNRQCRVLLVGSSAEYGVTLPEQNPIREDCALRPVSIYGLTKVFQTYLGIFYVSVHNLDIVTVRPFNLLGRGISARLFVGHVYQQIEEHLGGKRTKISVGNLESRRDYLAIEDAARAYIGVMQKGLTGEIYNVGSGASISIRSLLERILAESGLGMNVVEERPAAVDNKLDVANLFADVSKLRSLMSC